MLIVSTAYPATSGKKLCTQLLLPITMISKNLASAIVAVSISTISWGAYSENIP
jgi:hypothetical protein